MLSLFLSVSFSLSGVPGKKTKNQNRKTHLGEQVACLELAEVGVALDGGRGCFLCFFKWPRSRSRKGKRSEAAGKKKVAGAIDKERSAFQSSILLPLLLILSYLQWQRQPW